MIFINRKKNSWNVGVKWKDFISRSQTLRINTIPNLGTHTQTHKGTDGLLEYQFWSGGDSSNFTFSQIQISLYYPNYVLFHYLDIFDGSPYHQLEEDYSDPIACVDVHDIIVWVVTIARKAWLSYTFSGYMPRKVTMWLNLFIF